MKFQVLYTDFNEIAGHTETDNYEDAYLWRGGQNWHPAVFKTKEEAERAIRETNEYRKDKGWKSMKFTIVKIEEIKKFNKGLQ